MGDKRLDCNCYMICYLLDIFLGVYFEKKVKIEVMVEKVIVLRSIGEKKYLFL